MGKIFDALKKAEQEAVLRKKRNQTNDPSFVNTIMAGVMKVYTADGTLIKTSTIPSGYILGQSGPMKFATSFEDQAIEDVRAEIAMTDTNNIEKISKEVGKQGDDVKG